MRDVPTVVEEEVVVVVDVTMTVIVGAVAVAMMTGIEETGAGQDPALERTGEGGLSPETGGVSGAGATPGEEHAAAARTGLSLGAEAKHHILHSTESIL